MNSLKHVFQYVYTRTSLKYMFRSGIAVSKGVAQGRTRLFFKVLVPVYTHTAAKGKISCILYVFRPLAIILLVNLGGVKYYLIITLVCIFLITKGIEFLFIYLWTFYVSYLVKSCLCLWLWPIFPLGFCLVLIVLEVVFIFWILIFG